MIAIGTSSIAERFRSLWKRYGTRCPDPTDRNFPLLSQIPGIRECHFPAEGVLFDYGKPLEGVYYIKTGWVRILMPEPDVAAPSLVNLKGPGDLVGLSSIIFGGDCQSVSTINCITDAVTYFISCPDLLAYLEGHSDTRNALLDDVSRDLHDYQIRVRDILNHSVPERTSRMLLTLACHFGSLEGERGIRIPIPLLRHELASLVGTSTETLVRVLSDLKKKNLIITEDKEIILLEPEALLPLIGDRSVETTGTET